MVVRKTHANDSMQLFNTPASWAQETFSPNDSSVLVHQKKDFMPLVYG